MQHINEVVYDISVNLATLTLDDRANLGVISITKHVLYIIDGVSLMVCILPYADLKIHDS